MHKNSGGKERGIVVYVRINYKCLENIGQQNSC